MKLENLKHIIREEISKVLKEEYVDKFKAKGILVTDTTSRPQQEILSDIRALTGITVVSTTEITDDYSQDNSNLKVILNLKFDGYPFIKSGGFSRENINNAINQIKKIEGVKSVVFNPQNISPM